MPSRDRGIAHRGIADPERQKRVAPVPSATHRIKALRDHYNELADRLLYVGGEGRKAVLEIVDDLNHLIDCIERDEREVS